MILSPDIHTNCETFYINLRYRGAYVWFLFQGICIFLGVFYHFNWIIIFVYSLIHYFPALGVVHPFIFGCFCIRLGFGVWLQQLHLLFLFLFLILSVRLHWAGLPLPQTVGLWRLWLLVSLPAAVQPAGERLLHHQSQPRHGQRQHVQEHPGEWETLWQIDRDKWWGNVGDVVVKLISMIMFFRWLVRTKPLVSLGKPWSNTTWTMTSQKTMNYFRGSQSIKVKTWNRELGTGNIKGLVFFRDILLHYQVKSVSDYFYIYLIIQANFPYFCI